MQHERDIERDFAMTAQPIIFTPTKVTLFGETYEAHPATVRGLKVHREDHGILTAFVDVDMHTGGSQGFGGYCLDEHEKHCTPTNAYASDRRGTAYAGDWLVGLLSVLGSLNTADVKGRNLYVLKADGGGWGGPILGLLTFDGERWFLPKLLDSVKP
jgi:hypothetical protein